MDKKKPIRIWEPLLIAIAAAIGLIAGYNMNSANEGSSLLEISEIDSNQVIGSDGRIEEILRFVESKYVDSLDANTISVDAIRHILKQLDPHSDYITSEELDDHNEKMNGAYRGIGIETIKLNDTFYITQIISDGPADLAGLTQGDAIISVDDIEVSGNETSFQDVRTLLKQEEKDEIELSIIKLESDSLISVQVGIGSVEVASANINYLIDEETLYLKLERFSGNTYEQFIESIDAAIKDKTHLNLILDLRDNPGGYLPEAIKILSQCFEEKDKLLTYTVGLNRKKAEYRSTGKSFFNIKKIAVLLNENSASGSEILAGALQDWDRGLIIGSESFGKGLVQEIFPLKNGGALRLTVAKYYTPTGRLIQKSYRSINRDFIADSSYFQTRLLKREVESGNGIIPDIVSDDSNDVLCSNYKNYVDFFIVNQMNKVRSTEIDEALLSIDHYNTFLELTFNIDPLLIKGDCNGTEVTKYITDRYVRLTKGEIEYFKSANLSDPYIAEALDFISDKRSTLALLSNK